MRKTMDTFPLISVLILGAFLCLFSPHVGPGNDQTCQHSKETHIFSASCFVLCIFETHFGGYFWRPVIPQKTDSLRLFGSSVVTFFFFVTSSCLFSPLPSESGEKAAEDSDEPRVLSIGTASRNVYRNVQFLNFWCIWWKTMRCCVWFISIRFISINTPSLSCCSRSWVFPSSLSAHSPPDWPKDPTQLFQCGFTTQGASIPNYNNPFWAKCSPFGKKNNCIHRPKVHFFQKDQNSKKIWSSSIK